MECGNYRVTSLVSHAGKVLFKKFSKQVSNYCETNKVLPEGEQCGLRPDRSATDDIYGA